MTTHRETITSARGFSLIELVIGMAVLGLVMTGVMSVMLEATRANDTVALQTQANNNLRVAMDLITRDLLQVGQGLPTGRVVGIPSGPGADPVRRPGPLDSPATPNTIVSEFDADLVALPALTSATLRSIVPDAAPAPPLAFECVMVRPAVGAFRSISTLAGAFEPGVIGP